MQTCLGDSIDRPGIHSPAGLSKAIMRKLQCRRWLPAHTSPGGGWSRKKVVRVCSCAMNAGVETDAGALFCWVPPCELLEPVCAECGEWEGEKWWLCFLCYRLYCMYCTQNRQWLQIPLRCRVYSGQHSITVVTVRCCFCKNE